MGRTIREQVVVITGAGSGLGREMARQFGERGAKLMLGDINERSLAETVERALDAGVAVEAMVLDTADAGMVEALAQKAVERFGGIDCWINNAAVAVYGEFSELPLADFRRVIEVDLLGYAYGLKAALARMRQRGGTIICITSEVARRGVPLSSAYSAAQRGVTGLLEAVRVELEHHHVPIALCEVLPVGIDTPFFEHAKTYLGVKPQPTGQILEPERVAAAVARCAEVPRREVHVGSYASVLKWGDVLVPRLMDRFLAGRHYEDQLSRERRSPSAPSDFYGSPHTTDATHGGLAGSSRSPFTWMQQHPVLTAAGVVTSAVDLYGWHQRRGA